MPADMLNLRAELHLDLAAVRSAAGSPDRARSAADEAAALYARKGNLAGVRAARALLSGQMGTVRG